MNQERVRLISLALDLYNGKVAALVAQRLGHFTEVTQKYLVQTPATNVAVGQRSLDIGGKSYVVGGETLEDE